MNICIGCGLRFELYVYNAFDEELLAQFIIEELGPK